MRAACSTRARSLAARSRGWCPCRTSLDALPARALDRPLAAEVQLEAEACPDAYRTWATCSAAHACTDERATLDACVASADVYPICIDELVGDCFSEL